MTLLSLSTLGIEEIEPSVCADTIENRKILRERTVPYKIIEAGYLEVELHIEESDKTRSMLEKNKLILVDPKNPWSDYVSLDEAPLDFMEIAPAWLRRVLNKHNDAIAAGKPPHKVPELPVRCVRIRADGARCWAWAWPGKASEGNCRYHAPAGSFDYGAHFQKLTDAAKARLVEMQGPALDALEHLVSDASSVPHVRLKAATEILDRTGIRGGTDVTVSGTIDHTLQDPAVLVREKLEQLRLRHAPAELEAADHSEEDGSILEAEIVQEVQADD